MQINAIDVINRTVNPLVDIVATTNRTLTFNLSRTVKPTLVDVESQTLLAPTSITINKVIENPIGTTRVIDLDGPILSSSSRTTQASDPQSLIRTNILDLETPNGSIGQNPGDPDDVFGGPAMPSTNHRINIDPVYSGNVPAATSFQTAVVTNNGPAIFLGLNQFFNGELVRYDTTGTAIGGLTSGHNYYVVNADGLQVELASVDNPGTPITLSTGGLPINQVHTLTPVQLFTVKAAGDAGMGFAYLDVKARLRDNTPAPWNLSVIIDAVNTTGDADLRVWGSVHDSTSSSAGDVNVLYKPTFTALPGEPHHTFFNTPDPAAGLQDPGAFGTGNNAFNSTYVVKAMDELSHRWRPGIVSGRNIIVTAAEPTAGSPKIINIDAITDVTGTGYVAGPTDQHHVDMLTNGSIIEAEKTGDLRVGRIMSTANDVTLYSPAAIIDALNDGIGSEADVTGVNITMTAGDNEITGNALLDQSGFGGIGTPDNFLEVNEDVLHGSGATLGVLNAFDIAPNVVTSGIFITEVKAGSETHNLLDASVSNVASETVSDLEVDTVNTKGNVSLATQTGSIVDARSPDGLKIHRGQGDDAANVIGNTIDLFAMGGNIGNGTGGSITDPQANANNDLEIDSQAYAYGTIGARATGSIWLTEASDPISTNRSAQVVLLQALGLAGGDAIGGDVRFTVRETAALGEDLDLLAGGSVLFLEKALEPVPHGLINAPQGSILLRVGDNVNTDPNSQILAGHNINIYGDFARTTGANLDTGDPGYGTIMHLAGVIAHGPTAQGYLTRIFGNADSDQFYFDQTFLGGNAGTLISPIPGGGPTQIIPDGGLGSGNAGTMSSYSGGSTRAYGSNTPSPILTVNASGLATLDFHANAGGDTLTRNDGGDWGADGFAVGDIIKVSNTGDLNSRTYTVAAVAGAVLTLASRNLVTTKSSATAMVQDNKYAPAGDSEDFFIVNQLQSMVINQETTAGVEAGDTLTLDGQSGSDTYVVNTTGSRDATGDQRNYVVNVLDTGAPSDGVDNLSVYGRDNLDPNFNGSNPDGTNKPVDDVFLLRRTTGIANETANRPVQYADASGFVAVLDYNPNAPGDALSQARASDPTANATIRSQSVQRVNYDSSINGRLMVFGQGGNDYFASDDNAAVTTLDGGEGNDTFQIGQIYGLQRDGGLSHDPLSPYPYNTLGGSVVTPYDQFPQSLISLTPQSIYGTVATTRGWLSAGATEPLLAQGGAGDDSFTVYSNQAVVRLEGDDGNDLFTVRAFALAQTDPITGDIVWVDPVQEIAQPALTKGFSTAAETAIRTGAGDNQVEYNINAPVSVDGGAGFNKLVILGTEFADHIVVTDHGIFGAGMTVTYQNIQIIEVDALEGDDTIDVLSTAPGVAVRVIGGLGNDTINVAGDVAGDVVSRDINGTSSTVTHRVLAGDPAYDGLVADGLDLSVARPNQGQVIIDENVPGDTSPGFTDVLEGGYTDLYGVKLAHAPLPGTTVYVTVSAAMGPQEQHSNPVGSNSNAGLLGSGDIIDNIGYGDSILVSTPNDGPYKRNITLNGVPTSIPSRALVLAFNSLNYNTEQLVHVQGVNDTLPLGTRTITISHSVLSDDPSFDHAIVRNVEVTVHDNNLPQVVVTQLDPLTPTASPPAPFPYAVDNVTKELEGTPTTEQTDLIAIQLATQPVGNVLVDIKPADNRVFMTSSDPRFTTVQTPEPIGTPGSYTVSFNSLNWNTPFLITVHAVKQGSVADPHTTAIVSSVDPTTTDATYQGIVATSAQTIYSTEISDMAPGLFLSQSGGSTLVTAVPPATTPMPPPSTTDDNYFMRLTMAPLTDVNVAIITDGQTDPRPTAAQQASGQITLKKVGGLVPVQLFTGNITVAQVDAHTWTITRASGSETGSWLSDGFLPGDRIRIQGTGNAGVDNPSGFYTITQPTGAIPNPVTDSVITITDAGGSALPTAGGTFNTGGGKTVSVSQVNEVGTYKGNVEYQVATVPFVMFTGTMTISGNTITRADFGSFINDNFAPGEYITLQRADKSVIGGATFALATFQISTAPGSVTDSTLTLTTTPAGVAPGTVFAGATINKMLDSLRRTDGTSWLDSGFFEGQLIQIAGYASTMTQKVDLITGTAAGKLDLMVLTDHPAAAPGDFIPYSGRPLGGLGTDLTANISVVQYAAEVDFSPTNAALIWYTPVNIPLTADVYFDIQPGHQNLKAFPKVAHTLSHIQGPLLVEGGTTSADRSIVPAVFLPGEANAPPFNIPPQPPETQSIDTLNVYNDGTKGNDIGTLTSTALTGLNMGPGLDFTSLIASSGGSAHPFGESGVYPGGISYGTISIDPVTHLYNTDGSHSTIEVVNIFLGQGNDTLTVNSTLIPGPDQAGSTMGLVSEQGGITTIHGGGDSPLQFIGNSTGNYPNGNGFDTYAGANGTGRLVRTDGLPWANDGFAVGQQVLLSLTNPSGAPTVGSYTIIGIGNPDPHVDPDAANKPGSVLTLLVDTGSPALGNSGSHLLGSISVTDTLAVTSGQVIGTQTTGLFDVAVYDPVNNLTRVTREDGLPWASLGFAAGQQVAYALGVNVGNKTVMGFDNATATTGLGSVLLLSGAVLSGTSPLIGAAGTVSVTGRFIVGSGISASNATTLTRSSGSWINDGFKKGQAIAIGGQSGYWLVTADPTDLTLPLQGADLTLLPAVQKVAVIRIGGDNIIVNGTGETLTGSFFNIAAPPAGDMTGATNAITRTDGHSWNGSATGDAAYAVGQQLSITGEWSFANVAFARADTGDTIKRLDGGNWATDGFAAGMSFWSSGTTSTNGVLTNNGSWTVASVSADGSTLTLTAKNTVVPTATFGASEPMTVELSNTYVVTGFTGLTGQTVLLRGTTLPRQLNVPMTLVVDAPLVVYGDTSQDGTWYNGKSYQTSSLGIFGTKPQPHMDGVGVTLATPTSGQTNPSKTLSVTVGTFTTPDGTFGTITRSSGSWATDGFQVNGLITVDGKAAGEVRTFTATTLTLQGLTPAFSTFINALPVSHTVAAFNSGTIKLSSGQWDPGFVPEGLITIGTTYQVQFARNNTGDTITRTDGGSWITDGFAVGETISVTQTANNFFNYSVVGVSASTLTLSVANSVVPTAPAGTTEPARITIDVGTIAEVGSQYSVSFNKFANTISRTDGGDWTAIGFAAGQTISVYGTGTGGTGANNQVYKILSIGGANHSVLTLDPNVSKIAANEGPETAIIENMAAKADTLYLFDLQPGFLTLLNGASTQTLTTTVVERNRLGQNADFFVFPLASNYTFNGNDVIDASSLFATIPNGLLPAVGITAYGGGGDDTIIGSRAGDILAGGSGNDTIIGGRGQDQIFGDNGINVNVITRVLTLAQAAGSSGALNLDPLNAGNDLLYGDAPGSTANDSYGDYNDIVFGDLGTVNEATAGARDTTKPVVTTPQRIETTLLDRQIISQARQNAGNDFVYGNGGDDVLIGGAGNDSIDGGGDRDLIFGDNVSLSRSFTPGGTNPLPGQGLLGNYANPRFETLQGTQIYSTTLGTAGQDLASNAPQADPRGHGAWGDYLITLFDHSFTAPAGSYGDDYIAGGPADDMIFGELGNDVVQGDGSIDYVSHILVDNGLGAMLPSGTDPYGGRVGVVLASTTQTVPYAVNPGNPFRDANNALTLRPSFDGSTDGQDYIEGGGGNDIVFGNQGQDDLIGGSSDKFSLTDRSLRPDDSDLIFGGSGTAIARNAIGDATIDSNGNIATTANGHANDSDAIVGDNGDIIRLVGINGKVAAPVGNLVLTGSLGLAGNPVQSFNGFLRFNYDSSTAEGSAYDETVKIVVRAVRLIDYTPGGPDFDPVHQALDIGAADEIHGESGDDFIYGGKGSDWLYGEGQNDDVIGGYGNDWMSGGTGDDGMIGDDGRIYTSRNSLSSVPGSAGYLISQGEPLNGVAPLLPSDADPKYSNGNALNEYIFTPGNMQTDTINLSGVLKKTVDLTPFSSDPNWNGQAQPAIDEFAYPGSKPNQPGSDGKTTKHYDDIMFGGLGSDWMHGGSGDDAMSGAEALPVSYTQIESSTGDLTGIAETDYGHPFNPGDALRFNPTDPAGKFTHPHIAGRTGEFALYNENDPMRIILLTASGAADPNATSAIPAGDYQFFLNFNQNEGVFVPGGTSQQNGNQTVTYGPAHNDGNDVIFGDNGNDWIVGGTGRDHMYGGWGNDLLNADDDLTTAGGLNNVPETQPSYEDRAYGGAGKDVLIANTGGDRLIDWVGEYNSYLVPFSEFGMATVSRTLQPALHFFLYAESLGDGVDPTRFSDVNNGASPPAPKNNDPNPGRNGEPAGELGLVLQQDAAWHGQTGAPTDPQAGNTPGTQRDVLRTANFSGNGPSAMFADTGTWTVSGGAYQNTTASGDNVSLFDLNTWLPSYYEVQSTVKVTKGGTLNNGFIIFDYQNSNNFKYAGFDAANSVMKIGQRSSTGWADLATLAVKGLGINANQSILLAANGATATLTWWTYSLSYTFNAPLNTGNVGVGTNNSVANFTNFTVQKLPITLTYSVLEDFSDGVADNFTPQTGTWKTTSGTTGRYYATPPANDAALTTRPLAVAPLSYVEYSATVNAAQSGATAGLTFGTTSTNDFLYAGIVAGTNQVVLGHRSKGVWYVDATASATINSGTDYTLLVALTEETTNTVNVVLNGKSVVSFNYNYLVHDGSLGLFARNGNASFDNVLIRGDDIAYAGGGAPQLAAGAPSQPTNAIPPTADQLASIVTAAKGLWTAALGAGDPRLEILNQVTVLVSDLPNGMLGSTTGTTIVIDGSAAGWGWFIDPTPRDNSEFTIRLPSGALAAAPSSPAYGRMDLLTTVLHEMGNAMGFVEDHGQDVTGVSLLAGVRELPAGVSPGPELVPDQVAQPELSAPLIDWSAIQTDPSRRFAAEPPVEAPAWLADFLNNLGQDETHRNPNARIRISVPLANVPRHF
jgi:hypothetical protein